MTTPPDRRRFLRSLAGATVAVAWAGCTRATDHEAADGTAASSSGDPWTVRRPVVRPRGVDAVWVASPQERRPVAYLSMEGRQVFVDRAHRDRASWLLEAHISVSTGLWRIPLPGDAPSVPIPPGDEEREFEEMDMGAWDPTRVPAEGDVRILLGRRVPWVVPAGCVPVQGAAEWLATERLERLRCRPGEGEAVREDFVVLGTGRRSSDRSCADSGVEVDVFGWACPT